MLACFACCQEFCLISAFPVHSNSFSPNFFMHENTDVCHEQWIRGLFRFLKLKEEWKTLFCSVSGMRTLRVCFASWKRKDGFLPGFKKRTKKKKKKKERKKERRWLLAIVCCIKEKKELFFSLSFISKRGKGSGNFVRQIISCFKTKHLTYSLSVYLSACLSVWGQVGVQEV